MSDSDSESPDATYTNSDSVILCDEESVIDETNDTSANKDQPKDSAPIIKPAKETGPASTTRSRLPSNKDQPEGSTTLDTPASIPKRRLSSRSSKKEQLGEMSTILKFDAALKLVPEFSGKSEELQKFLTNAEIAILRCEPADAEVLFDLIKGKLSGRAYEAIRHREIKSFKELKVILKEFCTDKKTIPHLQLELNSCKQRNNEDVTTFSNRLENILSQLTIATCEGLTASQSTLVSTILRSQALTVFQEGLNQPLKYIVKARNDATLKSAIQTAINEESAAKQERGSQHFSGRANNQGRQSPRNRCIYCNRSNHTSEECFHKRTSFNKGSGSNNGHNNTVRYTTATCDFFNRKGHDEQHCYKKKYEDENREDNGSNEYNNYRSNRNSPNKYYSNEYNGRNRNYESNRRDNYSQDYQSRGNQNYEDTNQPEQRNEASSVYKVRGSAQMGLIKFETVNKPDQRNGATASSSRGARHYVGRTTPQDEECVEVLLKEAIRGRARLLLDSGTDISLIKAHVLRDDVIIDERDIIDLQGISNTGPTTMGQLIASIQLQDGKLSHPFHVVPENFPINSDGILGRDFLIKYKVNVSWARKIVEFGNNQWKLKSSEEDIVLPARSAVIAQVIAEDSHQGICETEKFREEEIQENYREEESEAELNKTEPEKKGRTIIKPEQKSDGQHNYKEKCEDENAYKMEYNIAVEQNKPGDNQENANGKLLETYKEEKCDGNKIIGISIGINNNWNKYKTVRNAYRVTALEGTGHITLMEDQVRINDLIDDHEKLLYKTCEEFNELYRIPSDPLTHTELLARNIQVNPDVLQIKMEPYHITERQKYIDQQMEIMLQNNIIKPSTSTFNSPFIIDKCEFLRKQATDSRHVILDAEMKPNSEKIEAVKDFQRSRKATKIEGILGLARYNRRFIRNFSRIVKPHNNQLKKNTAFNWTAVEEQQFSELQKFLISSPILHYTNFEHTSMLPMDTRNNVILSQREIGNDFPITYAKGTPKKTEINYPTMQKGNRFILIFRNESMKFSEVKLMPNQETETITSESTLNKIHGCNVPDKLLNESTNFLSDLFKNVFKLQTIKKVQTNGCLEMNLWKLLESLLADYLRDHLDDQLNWKEWITYAKFVSNTTPCRTAKFTTFKLLYGRNATMIQPLLNHRITKRTTCRKWKNRLQLAHRMEEENQHNEKKKLQLLRIQKPTNYIELHKQQTHLRNTTRTLDTYV